MKMTYLSRPPPNMNSIREVCDSLGLDSLTMFVRYHWATGGLRVNLTSVKGGIISDPLFACNIANDILVSETSYLRYEIFMAPFMCGEKFALLPSMCRHSKCHKFCTNMISG